MSPNTMPSAASTRPLAAGCRAGAEPGAGAAFAGSWGSAPAALVAPLTTPLPETGGASSRSLRRRGGSGAVCVVLSVRPLPDASARSSPPGDDLAVPSLLVVHHTPSPALQAVLEAVRD